MSKQQKRIPRKTIFIACEGTKTEPGYFENIKEEVEEKYPISITIYPDQNIEDPKTDAIGLVREAQSRMDSFDEVWAVFDKNGYTKHDEAFRLAQEPINGRTVNIAFSSIAFEHWVLLHFEKNDTTFQKSKEVIDYMVKKFFFASYEKNENIYPSLKDKTEIALENAAWLRNQQNEALIENGNKIHLINPYTNVDKLIANLFALPFSYNVRNFDVSYFKENGKIDFKLENKEDNFEVTITNKKSTSILFNLANITSYFKLLDQDGTEVDLSIEGNGLIEPNKRNTFTLKPSSMVLHGKFSFHFEDEIMLFFF